VGKFTCCFSIYVNLLQGSTTSKLRRPASNCHDDESGLQIRRSNKEEYADLERSYVVIHVVTDWSLS